MDPVGIMSTAASIITIAAFILDDSSMDRRDFVFYLAFRDRKDELSSEQRKRIEETEENLLGKEGSTMEKRKALSLARMSSVGIILFLSSVVYALLSGEFNENAFLLACESLILIAAAVSHWRKWRRYRR